METTGVRNSQAGAADSRVPVPLMIAALLSAVAGGVHGTLAPSHAAEAPVLGIGFAAMAAAQLVFAVLLIQRPTRHLLEAVAAGNAAMVILWAMSRTIGVPIGPDAWIPEAVGMVDALTLALELGCVWLCLALRSRDAAAWSSPRARGAMHAALVLVGGLGLFLLMSAQARADADAPTTAGQASHLLHAGLLAAAFVGVFGVRAVTGAIRTARTRGTPSAT